MLRFLLCLAAALLAACQTTGEAYDRPARIVDNDDASRAALRAAVSRAIGGNVTLSDDALTGSSVLTIENLPPPTMENPSPYGRIIQTPVQFRLVANGDDCILVDQRDRSRHDLPGVTCEAE